MVAQVLLALLLVARLISVQHALQRSLGVNHHLLGARHAHHKIWPQRPLLASQRDLLDEVAVLDHSGELDHVAELHLSPLPPGVRLAQCRHERAGLGTELLV